MRRYLLKKPQNFQHQTGASDKILQLTRYRHRQRLPDPHWALVQVKFDDALAVGRADLPTCRQSAHQICYEHIRF